MKEQARKTKRYVNNVGNILSAEEIVPLQFASNPAAETVEANRQLSLSLRECNILAREEGVFVRI